MYIFAWNSGMSSFDYITVSCVELLSSSSFSYIIYDDEMHVLNQILLV
jgi:hypothetical protein